MRGKVPCDEPATWGVSRSAASAPLRSCSAIGLKAAGKALHARAHPGGNCGPCGGPGRALHPCDSGRDDCTSARVRSSRPAPAMNERPAIAAVAVSHRDDPAALPPQPAVAIAAIPETPPDASVTPDNGEVPAPAVAPVGESVAPVANHSRTRSRHVARREGSSYSGRSGYSRQAYHAGGPGLW
jgi:hypothetical protein